MSKELLKIETAKELAQRVLGMQGSKGVLLFTTKYRVDGGGQIRLGISNEWWRVMFFGTPEAERLEVGAYLSDDKEIYDVTGGLPIQELEEIFVQLFKKLSVEKVCVAVHKRTREAGTAIRQIHRVETAPELARRLYDIQDTDETVTFATWFELDKDGQVNLSDIGEWWGAKFYRTLDGMFLQIGAYGGGDWYTYDATGGLSIEEIEDIVERLLKRFTATDICVEINEEYECVETIEEEVLGHTCKTETVAELAKRLFEILETDAVVTLVTKYCCVKDGQASADSDTRRWGIVFSKVFDGEYLLVGEYGKDNLSKFKIDTTGDISLEGLEKIAKGILDMISVKEVCVEILEECEHGESASV